MDHTRIHGRKGETTRKPPDRRPTAGPPTRLDRSDRRRPPYTDTQVGVAMKKRHGNHRTAEPPDRPDRRRPAGPSPDCWIGPPRPPEPNLNEGGLVKHLCATAGRCQGERLACHFEPILNTREKLQQIQIDPTYWIYQGGLEDQHTAPHSAL